MQKVVRKSVQDESGTTHPVEPWLAIGLPVHILPSQVGLWNGTYLGDANTEVQEVQETAYEPSRIPRGRKGYIMGEQRDLERNLRWNSLNPVKSRGDLRNSLRLRMKKTDVPFYDVLLPDDAFGRRTPCSRG